MPAQRKPKAGQNQHRCKKARTQQQQPLQPVGKLGQFQPQPHQPDQPPERITCDQTNTAESGFLWILGWGASRVVGQRLILIFEWLIGRIPFVERIYQATKRFLTVAGNSTDGGERRVVLINFPSPEMKTIALVTRILKDETTG